MAVQVQRRQWPQRFVRSYRGWRRHLGIVMSLRAAWIIANAKPRTNDAVVDPRARPGRDWPDVASLKHHEG